MEVKWKFSQNLSITRAVQLKTIRNFSNSFKENINRMRKMERKNWRNNTKRKVAKWLCLACTTLKNFVKFLNKQLLLLRIRTIALSVQFWCGRWWFQIFQPRQDYFWSLLIGHQKSPPGLVSSIHTGLLGKTFFYMVIIWKKISELSMKQSDFLAKYPRPETKSK